MQWNEIEQLIVDFVNLRCEEEWAINPRVFAADFAKAYRQLQRTHFEDPDYNLRLAGEAYCLKYHLQRMDNVNTALNFIHDVYPLLQEAQPSVLDVGGGTGSSTMAVSGWFTGNNVGNSLNIQYCEPALPMNSVAKVLVPRFLQTLQGNSSAAVPFVSCDINQELLFGCAATGRQAEKAIHDLVVFSFTFWKQEQREFARTAQLVLDIGRLLKSSAVMFFLTPDKPVEKSNS